MISPLTNKDWKTKMIKNGTSQRHRISLPRATFVLIATSMLCGLSVTGANAATSTLKLVADTSMTSGSNLPATRQDAAAANPGPSITGFRNATFGMTQAQVRDAIEAEFHVPASAITEGTNPIQRTGVLTVTVPALIPGGGAASIAYVFGYQSQKLIEINVVWSKQIDPNTTAQMIYQNGESLQQYFASEDFPPQRSSGNIVTSAGILLFRATDPSGNAVVLILSGNTSKDPKTPDKTMLDPTTLTLAYAENAQHPDVFKLSQGSF